VILAGVRLGRAKGLLEDIHGKIGVAQHRAFVFHSPAIIAIVLSCAGTIELRQRPE
jgi:hypothetical protein